MFAKPKDYDTAQSYDSDVIKLEPGGYVCKILHMDEETSSTGKMYVKVSFDIAEGEYKDFYANMYKRDKVSSSGRDAKWKGTYNCFPLTKEQATNPQWKGLLTCIEKSNNGFRVNWHGDYDQFKGKIVGLLFREEEYEFMSDGNVRQGVSVRACAARPVDVIRDGDFTPPKRKTLNKDSVGSGSGSGVQESVYSGGFTQVEDDELPF